MDEEVQKAEQGVKKAWPTVMAWVGGATALIGLFASLFAGVNWLRNHQKQKAEDQAKIALAQAQANQGEFQASVQTYAELLKADPLNRATLDRQLSATMLWVENFEIAARENQNAADLAAPELDQILPILDAGLTRTKGSEAANVQAHLGWAHWLNQRIAQREFGHQAETNLRAAALSDPSNAYANAMLGAWMLLNTANTAEAIHRLDLAASTGNALPFVRKLQFGYLLYLDKPGARAALVKASNDMRKAGEPLNDEYKNRVLAFCFDPIVTDHGELAESLSAVPPDDAWQTYLWLGDHQQDPQADQLVHDFVRANLLEISGKPQESLQLFRQLQQKLAGSSGTMKDSVTAAIANAKKAPPASELR